MLQARISVLMAFVGVGLLCAQIARADELARFAGLKGDLDIAGGTAHIPVMKEAAKRIMAAQPDIRITVAGGGSGVGVQQVGAGLAAIGNTGRALSEEEVAKYGLKSFPFAIDDLNPGHPLVSHLRRNPGLLDMIEAAPRPKRVSKRKTEDNLAG